MTYLFIIAAFVGGLISGFGYGYIIAVRASLATIRSHFGERNTEDYITWCGKQRGRM